MKRTKLLAAMLGAAAAFQPAGSQAAETAPPVAVAAAHDESAQVARELLDSMARYLADLPGFEVKLVGSYDAVQASGQKIEFSELRALALTRPDRLRLEQLRSDGTADLVVFDGRLMSVFDSGAGVYAQAPQPGSLDDALVYFVRELGMQLPLAAMLSTRFPDEIARRARAVDYVEFTEILPVPAHHIAGQTASVDFQVWIADGDRPLPLRIILTYRNEPGQPQFRVQFLDWKPGVPADAGLFAFEPPKGARQIAFAVQVPAIAEQAGEKTESAGGAQP